MHMLFPLGLRVSAHHPRLLLIPSPNLFAWRRSVSPSARPSPLPFSTSFGRDLGSNSPDISPDLKKFLSAMSAKQMSIASDGVCHVTSTTSFFLCFTTWSKWYIKKLIIYLSHVNLLIINVSNTKDNILYNCNVLKMPESYFSFCLVDM